MIALNFGARFFAILLIFFVAAATFYFHDFWNQSPPENAKTLIDALKNLSIIGALFMIAGYGRTPRAGRSPPMADDLILRPPPRRHADIIGGYRASAASPALRPCAARICCGERAGTPGKQGSPSGSRTRGACDSQNVS